MSNAPPPILTLIFEVEAAVSYILEQLPEANEEAEWATNRCDEIRYALQAKDATAAAMAACQLGERLVEIRRLGELARRAAERGEESNVVRRAREKAAERRAVFLAERKRTFSNVEAYKRTATKLGVSVKTIRRAMSEP